jgi:hypothetical protein
MTPQEDARVLLALVDRHMQALRLNVRQPPLAGWLANRLRRARREVEGDELAILAGAKVATGRP